MATYYVFFGSQGRIFQKSRSLVGALAMARGDEKRVFRHVDGIPNPWWMYGIKKGKVDKTKIFKDVPYRRLARLKPLSVFG